MLPDDYDNTHPFLERWTGRYGVKYWRWLGQVQAMAHPARPNDLVIEWGYVRPKPGAEYPEDDWVSVSRPNASSALFSGEVMASTQIRCYRDKIFSYFNIASAFSEIPTEIPEDMPSEEVLQRMLLRVTKLEVGKQVMLDVVRSRHQP